MSHTKEIAQEIINYIKDGEAISSIQLKSCKEPGDWNRYSAKAYQLYLISCKKKNKEFLSRRHTSGTSNNEINDIVELNELLSNYALLLPSLSTMIDFREVKKLSSLLPSSESQIISIVGDITMHPKTRAMQKKGRFEKFDHFRIFSKLLDAATLSYYRTNFISCYFTLVPVIEGIIIRWMGFSGSYEKPNFEDIRKFFRNSFERQPCPYNGLFHNVYVNACDNILNKHFFKPTDAGSSFGNFNRHVASHLLNDDQFATKENCIRLFLLIDSMAEIFLYESRIQDPRFELHLNEYDADLTAFANAILDNIQTTPEHIILGTSRKDTYKH